ncbi:MAG: leucine-rich repeat domain-containing protein [Limisphaerales bacterium]
MKQSLLATLCFLTLLAPPPAAAQQFGDFQYTNKAGAITITLYTGTNSAVVIPSTIDDLPVTSLYGPNYPVFYPDRTNLTSVVIPSTVTNIGAGAFGECSGLADVTIPSSVVSIGLWAFAGAGLTNVSIPSSVASLGLGVFEDCSNLVAITVDGANPSYSSVDGVLFDKARMTLIEYPGGKAGSYAVPAGTTSIGESAFEGCFRLGSITLPASVKNVGASAFACGFTFGDPLFLMVSGLTNLVLGSGVTNVGATPFYGCIQLGGVLFEGNPPSMAGDMDFILYDSFAAWGQAGSYQIVAYHMPGSSGWGSTFAGAPAVVWDPVLAPALPPSPPFSLQVTGVTNLPVVVEASTNLAGGPWAPLLVGTLTNSLLSISDPASATNAARFYRVRYWGGTMNFEPEHM